MILLRHLMALELAQIHLQELGYRTRIESLVADGPLSFWNAFQNVINNSR